MPDPHEVLQSEILDVIFANWRRIDAHNMKRLLEQSSEVAMRFTGPKLLNSDSCHRQLREAEAQLAVKPPRRTITGRVLRWAWKSGPRSISITSRRRPWPMRIDAGELGDLLGLDLCLRLYRIHGPRYLEHALLVGTARREPGERVYMDLRAKAVETRLGSMTSWAESGIQRPWFAHRYE